MDVHKLLYVLLLVILVFYSLILTLENSNLSKKYEHLLYISNSQDSETTSLNCFCPKTNFSCPSLPPPSPEYSGFQLSTSGNSLCLSFRVLNVSQILDTKSMEPYITSNHTVIFTSNFSSEEIGVGSIILFTPEWNMDKTHPIVHRVVSISSLDGQRCFITKGDNNDLPDPGCVPENDVMGVVVGLLFSKGVSVSYCQNNSIPFFVNGSFVCSKTIIEKGIYTEDQRTFNTVFKYPLCSSVYPDKKYTVISPEGSVACVSVPSDSWIFN